jgi:AcrR family transcriptional regulator
VTSTPAEAPVERRRRGGRPSREAAERLGEHILAVATELFLAHGYGATSIEAVAQYARISKRTFYHRFPDKAALFASVVHRVVLGLRPPAHVPLIEGADIKQILERLARLILRAALTPQALALNRLITAEALRFPELAAIVAREGAGAEAVGLIAGLLEREARAVGVALVDAPFAAEQFLQMTVGVPRRRALGLGDAMSANDLDAWAVRVVDLFLNGCGIGRPAAAAIVRRRVGDTAAERD